MPLLPSPILTHRFHLVILYDISFLLLFSFFFFFNDTATTEIYTLSLHDALPILSEPVGFIHRPMLHAWPASSARSEEHTSELQSHSDLVCRLLFEKKKKKELNDTR